MNKKQFKEIKTGDKIILFGDTLIVNQIEFSEKGLKQGKAKCRVSAKNEKTGEEKVIIRLVTEYANTP
ncbi:MAG: hypothetical protein ABIE22_02165 [archaeon]